MPHGKGVMGFIFQHLTQSTGGPRVSRIVRWFLNKDDKPCEVPGRTLPRCQSDAFLGQFFLTELQRSASI